MPRIDRNTRDRFRFFGFTVSYRYATSEYVVRPLDAFPGKPDPRTYYTSDLDDALETARAEWIRSTPPGCCRGTLDPAIH
jgi:hypothetical protein